MSLVPCDFSSPLRTRTIVENRELVRSRHAFFLYCECWIYMWEDGPFHNSVQRHETSSTYYVWRSAHVRVFYVSMLECLCLVVYISPGHFYVFYLVLCTRVVIFRWWRGGCRMDVRRSTLKNTRGQLGATIHKEQTFEDFVHSYACCRWTSNVATVSCTRQHNRFTFNNNHVSLFWFKTFRNHYCSFFCVSKRCAVHKVTDILSSFRKWTSSAIVAFLLRSFSAERAHSFSCRVLVQFACARENVNKIKPEIENSWIEGKQLNII